MKVHLHYEKMQELIKDFAKDKVAEFADIASNFVNNPKTNKINLSTNCLTEQIEGFTDKDKNDPGLGE